MVVGGLAAITDWQNNPRKDNATQTNPLHENFITMGAKRLTDGALPDVRHL